MAEETQVRLEKIGSVTMDYTYYTGQDLYSDGDIEDKMLDIAMYNPPEDFPKIIEAERSWPVFYHFSPLRTNIIDWIPFRKTDKVLEIGAGCGAISGALARRAGSVTCIDLSKKRSMVNAYRNRNADNITIMVGNFKDIEPHLDEDYDYVLLIGVFEYGQAYIGGENPTRIFCGSATATGSLTGVWLLRSKTSSVSSTGQAAARIIWGRIFPGSRGTMQAVRQGLSRGEAWKNFLTRQGSTSIPFTIHILITNL